MKGRLLCSSIVLASLFGSAPAQEPSSIPSHSGAWVIQGLHVARNKILMIPSLEPKVEFFEDGTVKGQLICNSFRAIAVNVGPTITELQHVTLTTRKSCYSVLDEKVEDKLLDVLRGGRITQHGRTIFIKRSGSTMRLVRAGKAKDLSAGPCRPTQSDSRSGPPPERFVVDSRGDARKLGFGHGALWVLLTNPVHPSLSPDGTLHVKLGFWIGNDEELAVEAERLDGNGNATVHIPGGYARPSFQPVGIDFSSDGCWKIVATLADEKIAFVSRIVVKEVDERGRAASASTTPRTG